MIMKKYYILDTFQMTWCDLFWHKMYRYFEDDIDIVMIKAVTHFQKYDYDIIDHSFD